MAQKGQNDNDNDNHMNELSSLAGSLVAHFPSKHIQISFVELICIVSFGQKTDHSPGIIHLDKLVPEYFFFYNFFFQVLNRFIENPGCDIFFWQLMKQRFTNMCCSCSLGNYYWAPYTAYPRGDLLSYILQRRESKGYWYDAQVAESEEVPSSWRESEKSLIFMV